jgi:hypothetical protein
MNAGLPSENVPVSLSIDLRTGRRRSMGRRRAVRGLTAAFSTDFVFCFDTMFLCYDLILFFAFLFDTVFLF